MTKLTKVGFRSGASEKSGSVLRPLQKYCNMPHIYSIKVGLEKEKFVVLVVRKVAWLLHGTSKHSVGSAQQSAAIGHTCKVPKSHPKCISQLIAVVGQSAAKQHGELSPMFGTVLFDEKVSAAPEHEKSPESKSSTGVYIPGCSVHG